MKKKKPKTQQFSKNTKRKLCPDFRDVNMWRKKASRKSASFNLQRKPNQHGKHHLCVSQTKWKPDSRVHDGRLSPWKECSHYPWSLITWQIKDGLSTFSYSPSLDFEFPHIQSWVQKLILRLGENNGYIKIYGINPHWHSCSKEFSVLTKYMPPALC